MKVRDGQSVSAGLIKDLQVLKVLFQRISCLVIYRFCLVRVLGAVHTRVDPVGSPT